MRRAPAILLLLCAVAYGVVWIAALREGAKVVKQPWPGDLGSLESLAQRFPRQAESAASRRLIELTRPLRIDAIDPALHAYVTAEIRRPELAIAEPPADAAAYLANHAIAIVAVREHLLSNGEITWATPDLAALMKLVRLFVANALVRARNGDAGAWTDLQAARNLGRSLYGHPELIAQIAALSMARTINAASWKMPLPAPPWIDESDDAVRIFQRSMQYEQWLLWKDRAGSNPLRRLENADAIERELEAARRIDKVTTCDFEGDAAWRRAFRYRAEREATRNALRIRAGQPLQPSRCSDGQWTFDGAWLRFSREIPTGGQDAAMPLALRVRE